MPNPNKLPDEYKGIGCENCGATGAKIFKTGQVKKDTNCLTRPKTCLKCNAVTITVETAIGCTPANAGPSPEVDHVVNQVAPTESIPVAEIPIVPLPAGTNIPLAAVAPASQPGAAILTPVAIPIAPTSLPLT